MPTVSKYPRSAGSDCDEAPHNNHHSSNRLFHSLFLNLIHRNEGPKAATIECIKADAVLLHSRFRFRSNPIDPDYDQLSAETWVRIHRHYESAALSAKGTRKIHVSFADYHPFANSGSHDPSPTTTPPLRCIYSNTDENSPTRKQVEIRSSHWCPTNDIRTLRARQDTAVPVYDTSFDDGPYGFSTRLDSTLNAANAKGSFFINGQNWDAFTTMPTSYSKIQQRPFYRVDFSVVSHTWSHVHMNQGTYEQLSHQLELVEQAMIRILGVKPLYMRPPYGEYNDVVLQVLRDRGYKGLIMWNQDSGDTFTPTPSSAQIIDSYRSFPEKTISLNHEIKDFTVDQVIPAVIPILQQKGFSLQTVPECLGLSSDPADWYVRVQEPGTRMIVDLRGYSVTRKLRIEMDFARPGATFFQSRQFPFFHTFDITLLSLVFAQSAPLLIVTTVLEMGQQIHSAWFTVDITRKQSSTSVLAELTGVCVESEHEVVMKVSLDTNRAIMYNITLIVITYGVKTPSDKPSGLTDGVGCHSDAVQDDRPTSIGTCMSGHETIQAIVLPTCAICHDEDKDASEIVVTILWHIFHSHCIEDGMNTNESTEEESNVPTATPRSKIIPSFSPDIPEDIEAEFNVLETEIDAIQVDLNKQSQEIIERENLNIKLEQENKTLQETIDRLAKELKSNERKLVDWDTQSKLDGELHHEASLSYQTEAEQLKKTLAEMKEGHTRVGSEVERRTGVLNRSENQRIRLTALTVSQSRTIKVLEAQLIGMDREKYQLSQMIDLTNHENQMVSSNQTILPSSSPPLESGHSHHLLNAMVALSGRFSKLESDYSSLKQRKQPKENLKREGPNTTIFPKNGSDNFPNFTLHPIVLISILDPRKARRERSRRKTVTGSLEVHQLLGYERTFELLGYLDITTNPFPTNITSDSPENDDI
ncbi:hypothetical protein H4Q26_014925 [Puccinia striiformis f. sp. tritici PST-130]|nr:hypothetical protein H4Q26_014925 [Puccinia striiformis f. sp. tritici PST-130]